MIAAFSSASSAYMRSPRHTSCTADCRSAVRRGREHRQGRCDLTSPPWPLERTSTPRPPRYRARLARSGATARTLRRDRPHPPRVQGSGSAADRTAHARLLQEHFEEGTNYGSRTCSVIWQRRTIYPRAVQKVAQTNTDRLRMQSRPRWARILMRPPARECSLGTGQTASCIGRPPATLDHRSRVVRIPTLVMGKRAGGQGRRTDGVCGDMVKSHPTINDASQTINQQIAMTMTPLRGGGDPLLCALKANFIRGCEPALVLAQRLQFEGGQPVLGYASLRE